MSNVRPWKELDIVPPEVGDLIKILHHFDRPDVREVVGVTPLGVHTNAGYYSAEFLQEVGGFRIYREVKDGR